MELEHYKEFANKIKKVSHTYSGFGMYVRLMEVFVQDSSFDIHQPFYGNVTKQKAKVIMELQTNFINSSIDFGKLEMNLQ